VYLIKSSTKNTVAQAPKATERSPSFLYARINAAIVPQTAEQTDAVEKKIDGISIAARMPYGI